MSNQGKSHDNADTDIWSRPLFSVTDDADDLDTEPLQAQADHLGFYRERRVGTRNVMNMQLKKLMETQV